MAPWRRLRAVFIVFMLTALYFAIRSAQRTPRMTRIPKLPGPENIVRPGGGESGQPSRPENVVRPGGGESGQPSRPENTVRPGGGESEQPSRPENIVRPGGGESGQPSRPENIVRPGGGESGQPSRPENNVRPGGGESEQRDEAPPAVPTPVSNATSSPHRLEPAAPRSRPDYRTRQHKFPLDAATSPFKQLHNRHAGQSCLFVGNGPSLNKMNYSFIENFDVVMGVNKIFLGSERFGWTPSYFTTVNQKVIQQSAKEIISELHPHTVKFLPLSSKHLFPANYTDYNIVFLKFSYTDKELKPRCKYGHLTFCQDISDGVHEGSTVTYASLQILYYMGCKQVFLIGVDHNFVQSGSPNSAQVMEGEDVNHFDPNYFGGGKEWDLADLADSEAHYRVARSAFFGDGRAILDATVDGKLTVFRKVDYRVLNDPSKLSMLPPARAKEEKEEKAFGVVIPYVRKRAGAVRWRLASTWQDPAFLPCAGREGGGAERGVDLIFYASEPAGDWWSEDLEKGTRNELRNGILYQRGFATNQPTSRTAADCFDNIVFRAAPLAAPAATAAAQATGEDYALHNHVVIHALSDEFLRARYSHLFFLDPLRTFPVRPHWLPALVGAARRDVAGGEGARHVAVWGAVAPDCDGEKGGEFPAATAAAAAVAAGGGSSSNSSSSSSSNGGGEDARLGSPEVVRRTPCGRADVRKGVTGTAGCRAVELSTPAVAYRTDDAVLDVVRGLWRENAALLQRGGASLEFALTLGAPVSGGAGGGDGALPPGRYVLGLAGRLARDPLRRSHVATASTLIRDLSGDTLARCPCCALPFERLVRDHPEVLLVCGDQDRVAGYPPAVRLAAKKADKAKSAAPPKQ